MIVKFDHIALSTSEWNIALDFLFDIGYSIEFRENKVRNIPEKMRLMRNPKSYHDIALLHKNQDISIELLNHGKSSKICEKILPIFNIPNYVISDKSIIYKANDLKFFNEMGIFTDIPVLIPYNKLPKKEAIFNELLIKATSLKKSCSFYKLFGFQTVKESDNYIEMIFSGFLQKNPVKLIINNDNTSNKSIYLNDEGFNCIGLISTSVASDKEKIDEHGYETTDINELILNNKTLEIFFVIGPNSEYIEIIGMKKT